MRVSCPFCNAAFDVPDPPPARTACPRCGERAPGEPRGVSPRVESPTRSLTAHGSPPNKRRSPQAAILFVAAMGLLGLGIGLFVQSRNAKEPTPNPEPLDAPAAATPPLELAGLGYLPADCNVVAAVQPGPVLAHAARSNRTARELLTGGGVPDAVFAALDRLGLPLQQIDHLAAGAHVPDKDETTLRLVVVLVLRRPLADEEQFLRNLEAKRSATNAAHYAVKVNKLPLNLARASDRVWVFSWSEADLATTGQAKLSPGLRAMVGERLPPDAAVWVAAESARWAEKPLVSNLLPALAGKKDWLPVLKQGQAAVAGLSLGDSPRLRLFVRGVDADTGEKLRAYFKSKAASDAVRTGGAGEWAMYDAPADGFGALRQMLEDVGK